MSPYIVCSTDKIFDYTIIFHKVNRLKNIFPPFDSHSNRKLNRFHWNLNVINAYFIEKMFKWCFDDHNPCNKFRRACVARGVFKVCARVNEIIPFVDTLVLFVFYLLVFCYDCIIFIILVVLLAVCPNHYRNIDRIPHVLNEKQFQINERVDRALYYNCSWIVG